MTTNGYQGYKDIFYHCIPIPSTRTAEELQDKLRRFASDLYDEKSSCLKSLLGQSLSKEKWIRRAQQMVINPDYDSDDNTFYISLFKQGSCSGKHDQVAQLFATKLMSNAPANHPIRRTVISSDKAHPADTTPWLTYKDGQLVAANPLVTI